MNFDEINSLTSEESKQNAEHAKAQQKAEAASLSQAFARLFKTDDGQKVLQHLSDKCLINNDTPIASPNINYEAAYKNGEGGVIKYIINQMTRAESL